MTETADERRARIEERRVRYEKRERAAKYASGYLKSSRDWLYGGRDEPLPHAYSSLLTDAIDTAKLIVEYLPEDRFTSEALGDAFGLTSAFGLDPNSHYNPSDDLLEEAQKLVAAIEKRREQHKAMTRILVAENADGRTPEEAATFLAWAAKEREKWGFPPRG